MNLSKSMTLSEWKKIVSSTEKAAGYTPAAIRRMSGQSAQLTRVDDTSFKLESEKLEAIKQQSSKGFQVIDITPANVTREEAFCAYPGDVINQIIGVCPVSNINLVGSGDLFYDDADGVFTSGTPVPVPYWRSVYLPIVGNFLKIEYLPSRIGVDTDDIATSANDEGRIQDSSTPQDTNEPSFYDFYLPNSPGYYHANKISSDRMILIDFNEPSTRPLIAKHGERFKNYFSGVWITFKANSPRIRVTIGFNSEISTVDDRPKNLHLWRGHGVMNDSFVNPVPFSVSDFEADSSLSGLQMNSLIKEVCLFANPIANAKWEQNGLSLLWLTGGSLNWLQNTDTTPDARMINVSLYVKKLGVAPNFTTGSVKLKRLMTRSICFTKNMTFSGTGDLVIPEPIRIALRPDTGIFLRAVISFGVDNPALFLKYSFDGYSLGPMQSYQPQLRNGGPQVPRYKLGENPYPIDLDDYRMPNI